MKKTLLLILFTLFLSCEKTNDKPKVIAYYTGNGETINDFNLSVES